MEKLNALTEAELMHLQRRAWEKFVRSQGPDRHHDGTGRRGWSWTSLRTWSPAWYATLKSIDRAMDRKYLENTGRLA